MTTSELMLQIKEKLQNLYGERFQGLILYGSEARDEADTDSDIDLLCLLEGPISSVYREIQATTDAAYALQLEYPDRVLHIMPVDADKFRSGVTGFYRIVQREGIPV